MKYTVINEIPESNKIIGRNTQKGNLKIKGNKSTPEWEVKMLVSTDNFCLVGYEVMCVREEASSVWTRIRFLQFEFLIMEKSD